MSISIDELYQKLLDSGISEAEIERQMLHKGNEFGGFMSKQGILFIIAKELGINIQSPDINEQLYNEIEDEIDYDEFTINISELEEEMRNIVLLGKIIQIYEPREFSRKDGSIGKIASFLLGDGSKEIKVIIWDDKVDIVKNEFFRVAEVIRIIGAYCKKGKNNNLEVHLGKRGKIILAPEITNKTLKKRLNNLKVDISDDRTSKAPLSSRIDELVEKFNCVRQIQGQIQVELFKEITKKSGDKTFLLKLLLSDDSATIPVLIWGMRAIEYLKIISNGETVVISNVVVKRNTYSNEKELVFTKNSSLEIV
ncbi:MAG: hypothetical protein KGD74_01305 [Candidatus Lokiarchaeota archaeon]|nr:hypothetical protein [Candidatus Lokiarchaeota archaeon]